MRSYENFENHFQDSVGEQKKYLYESYEHIKQEVIARTINPTTCTFWHNYMLSNHPERIIDRIFEVIRPFLNRDLTLSVEEQYILLCSAYLHDLVKFFPSFRIDYFQVQPLTPDQINEIEKFHDFDVFRILMFHIFPQHSNALKTAEHFDFLEGLIEAHNFFKDLKDIEERKTLIESIAIICGLHKSLTLEAEKIMQDRMNKFLMHDETREETDKKGEKENVIWDFGEFREIRECISNTGIKIDLLAAFLKLGDCFDISEERINKNMIKDVEVGLSKMENAKVLAKWYQFNIVKKIDVVPGDNNMELIINYCIPPALKKEELEKLTFFRMLAEKDFEDLTYLKVIEYYLSLPDTKLLDTNAFESFLINKYNYISIKTEERPSGADQKKKKSITITAKYKVRREKKGDIIQDVIKYIDKTLDEYKREKPEIRAPIKPYKIFSGYESSPNRIFPTSKNVLFILSFFDRYPDEEFSIKEIQNKTGLNSVQIDIACKALETSKYLEKRDNKYRIEWNGEKGEELKQIMEEYQRNPYNLKIKAWEIENFGKFLPLENITKADIIPTEIPGLDKILSDKGDNFKGGIKADKCIMIKGAPGTGKTTFAVQLLLTKKDLNCLYLTFEEDLKQLKEDFKDIGFDLSNIKFVTLAGLLSRKPPNSYPEEIFNFLTDEIDKTNPDILVVDSITRFREFADEKNVRAVLSDFMSILKIRHITSFFIGEEVKDGYNFEDYLVDGIIKLGYQKGKRCLKIMKIRGQDFASGAHSYKIFGEKVIQNGLRDFGIKPGINVYPNLNTYLREIIDKSSNRNLNLKSISSGTKGLDDILPIDEEKGGFVEGEFILVAGSPGSGKTLIGLQFLNGGRENDEEEVLWISFEGGLNQLKKSIGDMENLAEMIADEDYFRFKYFAPLNINLDEFVYIINCFLKSGIKRIVIDSISDLIAVFKDKLEFKNFVNSFLQILHDYGATTMLLYRVPNFFGSPETLGIEITSIVDTILLLKNVEVHNEIEKGIFVLKMRGRRHKSEIRSVITSEKGLEIRKLGWHVEGLLSGTVGQIHEPEVFIKLFYENEAESKINEKGATEFQDRYPTGRVKVTTVRKPEIHIDVWSFREERGPSHSNVKIVSVKQYWAIGFLEEERLYPLADYMPGEMKTEKEDDIFWKECLVASKTDGKNDAHSSIHLIPYYADINVLTYRKDVFNEICEGETDILKITKEKYNIEIKNDLLTMDNITDLAKKVMTDIHKKGEKGFHGEELQYYFAMPYLFDKSSFMTFFLDVLWAYGGNIFKIPDVISFSDGRKINKEDATPHDLRRYVLENLDKALVIKGDEAVKALTKLKSWVFVEEFSPNPFEGNFSDKALFSIQWYSKIKEKRDIIGVAAPPTGPKADKGYMTYDLCCLALIKGAIAPEMGWLFIDTLASTKNMKEMAEKKLALPAAEEAYYNKEFIGFDKEANGIVKDFILQKKANYELKTLSRIPYYYKIEGMIHNEITDVFHPNEGKRKEVELALNNAYNKIKKFLEDKKQIEKI